MYQLLYTSSPSVAQNSSLEKHRLRVRYHDYSATGAAQRGEIIIKKKEQFCYFLWKKLAQTYSIFPQRRCSLLIQQKKSGRKVNTFLISSTHETKSIFYFYLSVKETWCFRSKTKLSFLESCRILKNEIKCFNCKILAIHETSQKRSIFLLPTHFQG